MVSCSHGSPLSLFRTPPHRVFLSLDRCEALHKLFEGIASLKLEDALTSRVRRPSSTHHVSAHHVLHHIHHVGFALTFGLQVFEQRTMFGQFLLESRW
jgi:hypothetical protein